MLALIGGALTLALATTEPAYAQSNQANAETASEATEQAQPQRRARNQRSDENPTSGRRNQRRAAAAPTPEQSLASVRSLIAPLGNPCQLSEAVYLGQDDQRQNLYEAACTGGPGFLILASEPPVLMDCFELAGAAAATRARDPEAELGQQCALPANDNALEVIGGWAREAGANCTVDEALAVGSAAGRTIYEIGCANADGYRLEKADAGWTLQPCMEVVSGNGTCQFTTPAEQVAGFRDKLVGTDASDCDVQAVRLMGSNDNGKFYETRCAAGNGFIARVDTAGVTQQVYACETAQAIGGGCTLTPAPAATDPES